ncbi:MAG: 50S ribosomal protein L17 [Candidatus Levybacteria bacterium CG_4_9_14_3_um_filter_35_16]|nr:MAG: 50S ribosomal protein L17 [Candidatus Levybacteria bacterium CG22_combo_CG10-13_8_21_14_all_35_11]PIZ97233.1 MAG: 50S ribosomal protein L17 [Candidatus Levybacteria bacterium CG_4_10_14_0_2_um_filter_35_8]PJA91360.1 MAG: 50S ribosomal protein L17 [Candidatus Levybacteria bacterium CG_4_9_14_3_um_filter_35_16]PJC54799.1 MAG: 50S ribosomal protein L17 [Candidatus Levybacteria bacterium CG_4_9_14_0_2_um_filter_35_21]
MRKKVFGRQFKRDKNERQALFKGLLSSLVLEERIQTTEQKAKAIKGEAEKLVAKAKKEVVLAKKLLGKKLNPKAIEKMISDVAPRFDNRSGGYTRIIRIGRRFGDDANMVILEWVEKSSKLVKTIKKKEIKKFQLKKVTVKKKIKPEEKKTKKESKK